jgi:hypothetical protein
VVSLEFGKLREDEREITGICEHSVGRASSGMVLLIQPILGLPVPFVRPLRIPNNHLYIRMRYLTLSSSQFDLTYQRL